jgi:hypothetical protein
MIKKLLGAVTTLVLLPLPIAFGGSAINVFKTGFANHWTAMEKCINFGFAWFLLLLCLAGAYGCILAGIGVYSWLNE